MHASEVSGKLFEQLNFRGERQKVISSNIANVNTPEYKTKDLVFSEELKEQNILKLKELQITICKILIIDLVAIHDWLMFQI